METLLLLSLVISIGIISYLLLTWIIEKKGKKEEDVVNEEEDENRNNSENRRRIRRRGIGRRRSDFISHDDNENDVPVNEDEDTEPSKKIGVKKRAKLEMKEKKREFRVMEEERRERKREIEERNSIERSKRQEELDKIDEQERIALEKAVRDAEERDENVYKEWKGAISVEGKGSLADERTQAIDKLRDFIIDEKLTNLDDLSCRFGIRTDDLVEVLASFDSNSVPDLEKIGSSGTGVLDRERGRFLWLTTQEMEGVAQIVRRRGRISIDELTRECNSGLIKLP